MSNNDLQSILARHNLKGINVANFSQPRSHQPAPSRSQPYQYPVPVPQPQQVYQYAAVPRQQWAPPAEAAMQQVRPSFAWPSAPQPQYTVDPRHYSYNIWGKAPVYSLTGEDEYEKGEDEDENEREGEGEAAGGVDTTSVGEIDADADTKAEESIEAEKAATEDTITEEDSARVNITPLDEPYSSESTTAITEEAAAEPAKEEIAPEPPSEESSSEPIETDISPAPVDGSPAAPSSGEEAAASKEPIEELTSLPEDSQDPATPAPSEEETKASESAVVDLANSESAEAIASDASAEEKAFEEPVVAAVVQDDNGSAVVAEVTGDVTQQLGASDAEVETGNIEQAAGASESVVEDPSEETLPEDSPEDDSPVGSSSSQDPPTADPASVDSPDKDPADGIHQRVDTPSASETIHEPESDATDQALESDTVVTEAPNIEAVEQQPPATEPEEEPTEEIQVTDSTSTNDEPAAIMIDVGDDGTTADDTVVVVDVPSSKSGEIINVPPPPHPAPHVSIAEPMRPSKVSSRRNSSRSTKSRQTEKPREVKPINIILLRERKPKAASKSKVKAKKSRGKVVETAMKAFEDIPPSSPPLVVAVPEYGIVHVPPPAPSPPPAGDVADVADTDGVPIVVTEVQEESEEVAVTEPGDPPAPQDDIIASPDQEAAGHQDQDSVVENKPSTSTDPELNAEQSSASLSDLTKSDDVQVDSLAAEITEPVDEAAVSAEDPVKDLAATVEGSEDQAAKNTSAGDGQEVMPLLPQYEDTSLTPTGSDVTVDDSCALVSEAVVSDGPATVSESGPDTAGKDEPGETANIKAPDSETEKNADVPSAFVYPATEDEPELVAESAPAPLESEALIKNMSKTVEEAEENELDPEKTSADAGAVLEERVSADFESSDGLDADHANDGVVAIIVHSEEGEGIDAGVDVLPEAPMPPGSYVSEDESESGSEGDDGIEEQDQEMERKATTENIDGDEPEGSPAMPVAVAVAVDEGVTEATDPVEEVSQSVSDHSTAKAEAERFEATDQAESVNAKPVHTEGASPVSPVETPDAAVNIAPADHDALSPASDSIQEAEPKIENEKHSEVVATNSDEQVPEDSKVDEEPVIVGTPITPESEVRDTSSTTEELGDTESPETLDTQQAPTDQKLEDEATGDVETTSEPDVAEEMADSEKTQKATEPVATQESGEIGSTTEGLVSRDGEGVTVAKVDAPSEQMPAEHDAMAPEDVISAAAEEQVAQDPAVGGDVTGEAAGEAREPVTDAVVDESATENLASDATEERVVLDSAVEVPGGHESALTGVSEPVADDSAHDEPCETTTERNFISDQESSPAENSPEQISQAITDYIPEPPADTPVDDIQEAENASTEETTCEKEGGTISNNPPLQMLVEDVQSDSAKELLESRPAQSPSDKGDQDIPDPVATEPVVEKSFEPDEEPSPKLPSTSTREADDPEAVEAGLSAPSHGFDEEEDNLGPQDSISQRSVPVGMPQVESVYTELPYVPEMSEAVPPMSAASASRASVRGPPSASVPAPASKASVCEPPASPRAPKQPSRTSPPKAKRRSGHNNGTTRVQVKDVSRPTGDPKAPVEIIRRTTTKTTPPTNIFGMRTSSSRSSRKPSETEKKLDELAARERETQRKLKEAHQRAEIAERARKLREQEAQLAAILEAENTARREERKKREREELLAQEALYLKRNAKQESSRTATEPERPSHRHRRRHTDRTSDSHRRHRDERPRTRKHSSSHRDEQIREQSPHPQPQPREPRVRRYRTEEIGSERRRTEEVDTGVEEVYTREEPMPSRRAEERRRHSHREGRKEQKPKGLFESLKNVLKKL